MDNSYFIMLLSSYPSACLLLGFLTFLLAVVFGLGSFSTFHKAIFKRERFHFYYTVQFLLCLLGLFHYYDLYDDLDSTLPEILVDAQSAALSMTFSLLWPLGLLAIVGFLILKARPEERESLLFQDWQYRFWEFLTQSKRNSNSFRVKRQPGQLLALIIGKDLHTNRMVRLALEAEEFAIAEAEEGAEGLSLAAFNYPDLVVLDYKTIDTQGESILDRLREWTQAPVMILNSGLNFDETIENSDGTNEQYLPTPLLSSDLKEQIAIVMRHVHHNATRRDHSVFQAPIFKLDQSTRTLTVRKKEVHLTPHEFHLLSYMAQHSGQVVTLRMIRQEFWGKKMDEDALRRYIHNLRYKIEFDPVMPKYILTEPGEGYRLKVR